jgi:hydrogenase maturation protease
VVPALAHLTALFTIIGCGNANRSDDGVGVFVARALLEDLAAHPRAGVRVFDAGTGGMDVMFQARGSLKLVLVDAVRSGSEPGAIFRVPGQEFAAEHAPSYTLHDFRWDHALAAGRKIFREQFPADVSVVLVEAASVDLGLELSTPVREAAQRVIAQLRQEMDEYRPPA